MINILIIDDNKIVRKFLKTLLIKFGNKIETAADGREGIQMFDDNFFDLVTTDLSMPEIDGNGVARYIRNSDRPNTPIIGISGTPWLFEENNFDVVLQKPFSKKEMENSLKKLTDQHFIG